MGELLVFPFLSKFPIPTDTNVSKARILNEWVHDNVSFTDIVIFVLIFQSFLQW